MKRRKLLTATVCAVFLALSPVTAVGDDTPKIQNQTAALLGCWQCQRAGTLAALIFHSLNDLSQDGAHYRYMLIPGAIRVFDGYEFADYYYQTDGIQLAAIYPDGSIIYCVRSACSSLVTNGNKSRGSASGGHGGRASGSYSNELVTPPSGGGSWDTEGDRQYGDDSGGYGGGVYENPTSNYYDYNN
jgi:hypothetical protein